MRRRRTASAGGTLSARPSVVWTARALIAAVVIPPLLEIASFAKIERWLERAARLRFGNAPDDVTAAQWVDRVLGRLPRPWTATCLRRSAVLYYLLRSRGELVELYIGVRRTDRGSLGAHAWLVRDNQPYLQPPKALERISDYSVIARFPATR